MFDRGTTVIGRGLTNEGRDFWLLKYDATARRGNEDNTPEDIWAELETKPGVWSSASYDVSSGPHGRSGEGGRGEGERRALEN